MRRLAGYMVHLPIALERLRYRPETGQVIYDGRQRGPCGDASTARIFPALDRLVKACVSTGTLTYSQLMAAEEELMS